MKNDQLALATECPMLPHRVADARRNCDAVAVSAHVMNCVDPCRSAEPMAVSHKEMLDRFVIGVVKAAAQKTVSIDSGSEARQRTILRTRNRRPDARHGELVHSREADRLGFELTQGETASHPPDLFFDWIQFDLFSFDTSMLTCVRQVTISRFDRSFAGSKLPGSGK